MYVLSGIRLGAGAVTGILLLADICCAAPSEIQDAPSAPKMVVIGPGSFWMGTSAGELKHEHLLQEEPHDPSAPQHLVTIRYSFAIARFDVTRDEYAQFVAETNRRDRNNCYTADASDNWNVTSGVNWRSPGFSQTGKDPVVCVSWNDARAYANWLSAKTGQAYRLPTEAEWEYAARAGTTTARYWGEDAADQCTYANGEDSTIASALEIDCSDGYVHTSPVGTFRPNAFGLYDMMGNVWQWTQDRWHENYNGAPTDGSTWQTGDDRFRVRRGGSWNVGPAGLRSAVRGAADPSSRFSNLGFRVVREIRSVDATPVPQ